MASNLPSLFLDTALSVSGLTAYLQAVLEDDPQLQQVWVTGEVSSANQHRSGLFFTLQDPDATAAINCVVWNSQLAKLAVQPSAGEQVIVLGRISLHPQRGSYQLMVWQALPAGEGLRALRDRQLRNRLEAEGLFDPDRKRPLPAHPQAIAVVTSQQAAAWGDIRRTLKRRYPGLRVLLSPALVQGEQAPTSIVQAIRRVERDGRAEVLIVSRGGGAVEDLACFNDERVVRAIADCSIPVVAGIGHQRDESLADLAADVCAHTPTAAAEQSVPQLAVLYLEHQERIEALNRTVNSCLSRTTDHVYRLRDRLQRLNLDQRIHQKAQSLGWLRQRLIHSAQQRVQSEAQHCNLLRQKLQTLDPQAVLQRGYAVVRQENGAIVKAIAQITSAQPLTIQLAQGQLRVQVIEVIESPSLEVSSPENTAPDP